jgi:selenoprotein W-related protein
VSLVADLLTEFEQEIESLTLIPSEGGRFELIVNDQKVFSKLDLHRHAEPGELVGLIRGIVAKSD